MNKLLVFITFLLITEVNSNSQGWEVLNSNVTTNLYGVDFIDYNTGIVCGLSGTMIKTTNSGLVWFNSNSGLSASLYDVEFVNDFVGFCCGTSGIFKTTNSGLNWFSVLSGLQINEIEIITLDIIYAGGFSGVYKSTNQGLNWNNTTTGYSGQTWGLHFIDENTGYAMGSAASTRKTTNGGLNWFGGLPWFPGEYTFNECHFFNSGTGFVLYSSVIPPPNSSQTGGIYKANSMNSFVLVWSAANRSLGGLTFTGTDTAYAVGGGLSGTAYVAIILQSIDGGDTWSAQQTNFINQSMNDLCFLDSKFGFAVGRAGTIIKTQTGGVNSVNLVNENIPESFSLSQNYPNPFNPSTKILFSIPFVETTQRVVSLKVYDALGREVTTLVNQQLSPGTYQVEWNASNYTSGLYFYKLTSGDFAETKKMILIK